MGEKLGMLLTIHLDPVETDDALTAAVRTKLDAIIQETDPRLRFHDFRMVRGEKQTNLIFVPAGTDAGQIGRYKSAIRERAREIDPTCVCVIDVDIDYCGVL